MDTVTVPDEAAMVELGRRLGRAMGPGDAVCLTGPLGAGKTTMTRGLAEGLGADERVVSPTFVISRRYRGGRCDLVHCDAYRLSPDDDFADVVPDPDDVVTVVEWGEPVMSAVADSWLSVHIDRGVGQGATDSRHVTFIGIGPEWDDVRVSSIIGTRS